MPYVGKAPVGGGFHKLDALTASATATYALTLGSAAYFPETANQLLVSLNGVIQAPQDSFTVSGSNLVFDSALTSSDSIDFVVALGDVLGVGSVTDGAVTTAKIGNNAVTDAKIAAMAASKLTGSVPSAAMPAGSVLQVVSTAKIDSFSTTSSMADVTGLSVDITPSSSSNKILILVQIGVAGLDSGVGVRLLRGSTDILLPASSGSRRLHSTTGQFTPLSSPFQYGVANAPIMFLDSPNTTSATTYKVQAGVLSSTIYVNMTPYDLDNGNASRATSTITAMEIAG